MYHNEAGENGNSSRKYGNLELVRGDDTRHLTPEQWLDRDFHDLCVSCKTRRPSGTLGGYACRAVADVAQGLRFPLRVIARIVSAVIVGDGPQDFEEKVARSLVEFGRRKRAALSRSMPPRDDNRAAIEKSA